MSTGLLPRIDTALFVGGPQLTTVSQDGRNFVLVNEKRLRAELTDGTIIELNMPIGGTSDGASMPEFAAILGFTPYGPWWGPAYAHDGCFQNWIQKQVNGLWVPADFDEATSNDLINALMFASGVDDRFRVIIKKALDMFGWYAFHKDRQASQNAHVFK